VGACSANLRLTRAALDGGVSILISWSQGKHSALMPGALGECLSAGLHDVAGEMYNIGKRCLRPFVGQAPLGQAKGAGLGQGSKQDFKVSHDEGAALNHR
jgi:hypothetical protein